MGFEGDERLVMYGVTYLVRVRKTLWRQPNSRRFPAHGVDDGTLWAWHGLLIFSTYIVCVLGRMGQNTRGTPAAACSPLRGSPDGLTRGGGMY